MPLFGFSSEASVPPDDRNRPGVRGRAPTSTSADAEHRVWSLDGAGASVPSESCPPTVPRDEPPPEQAARGRTKSAFHALPLLAALTGLAGAPAMDAADYDELRHQPIVAHYEGAFRHATGVPMKVVPPTEPRQPLSLAPDNPFCALIASSPKGCEACRALQARAQRAAPKRHGAYQITCFAGMTDVAVPVMIGERHIATLFSGQVFRREPTERDFTLVAGMVGDEADPTWEARARAAYFATPVVSAERFQAVVQLLNMFAHFLADYASRHTLVANADEPAAVRGAKEYVRNHVAEPITLDQVVAHVGVSRFYFCKLFKKATGMTLTEHVSRMRVESAKTLLGNPALRISEIVFAAGFGSIPHFNSMFKRYTGQSPTDFREGLHRGSSADDPPEQ